MSRKMILHMLTPLRQMSPFDVNMALDAGYDAVVPYTDVALSDVGNLVQDAIFSRPPDAGVATGIFIAGKDAPIALDMLDAAKNAMVPPFEISVFADPAGSFTTAAAMVAKVEKALLKHHDRKLEGASVVIFGATGVVGYCTAVITAQQGANVTIVGHDGIERVKTVATSIRQRFNLSVEPADGSNEEKKSAILQNTEVVLAAAKAGVQVLSTAQLGKADKLLVAADVNAVPPAGIEGLKVNANGEPLDATEAVGIGPLSIGNVKYKTQAGLFEQMIRAKKPVIFDFRDAFALARELVK
ncbi:NAD(P)-dependent methylenetetrahydromethanopterin dehydrogenase [Phyllobacterium sp. P30BS-XVII]|uniref:NAD(P)-dependent methylenetetrahydromethanopterin dehydrogenase n=1 Tax=Phyllobacterium sp. P30BS-XVII TaxID=2587046 RepID=UPI0015FA9717|nr:NAD(P)-dependent methylenetetrahydromethanopterin dehydrogenase [Phyllobacterium sp. P30BS-XVII]MBA8903237.1 methylene-tetrahydromethanopterin dehydrogenase [Phyllobacterium sp. P30BS-XVII]